jgi:hypothetical protein
MLEVLCEDLASAMFGMLTPVEVATTRGCSRAMLARFDQSARAVWGAAASHILLTKVLAHIPTARAAAAFCAMYPSWQAAVLASEGAFMECALPQACSRGWLSKLQWIASNVRTVGIDLNKPLNAACKNGHLTIVQWLIRTYSIQRARLEKVRSGAFDVPRAYLGACERGHLQIVQWFVAHYELDSWIDRLIGVGGVVIASCSDRLEVVQWIFGHFYFGLTEHETALKHASKWGSLRVAQWAFDQATISDDVASELMLRACTHERLAMVRLIVDRCDLIPDGSRVCWFDDTKRRLTLSRIHRWFDAAMGTWRLEIVQWLVVRFQLGCVDLSPIIEFPQAPGLEFQQVPGLEGGRARVRIETQPSGAYIFRGEAGDYRTLTWLKNQFEPVVASDMEGLEEEVDSSDTMEEVDGARPKYRASLAGGI